jgi:hypothetical protein
MCGDSGDAGGGDGEKGNESELHVDYLKGWLN